MGRIFAVTLEGKIYSCKHCGTHLALSEDVVSKEQTYEMVSIGFLVEKCSKSKGMRRILHLNFILRTNIWIVSSCSVNVTLGEKVERMMMTGVHVVVDIFCVCCGSIVGWKYEMAYAKNQKYKEGKSVLERFKISGPDGSHYCVSHGAYAGGSDDADDI